ncbi:MAG TPA: glycosyltransferase family 2 protein [Pyrinomonadaceae bacterium]|nr:glycosyltransferase family 2 protein [Pyrinomonadaceae bacterium]
MNRNFDLSIIISSYNREDTVLETVKRLFESDFSGFLNIELIVIDDGSPRPVADALAGLEVPAVIDLKLIRQENAGIGATRNRGFREAGSDLVLFLDDDILLESTTLKEITEAHRNAPGAVVFGNYPFISHETESLHKFARHLYGYDAITKEASFEKVDAITSGLLWVDKSKIREVTDFYRDDLSIPAAEEYEIIVRFHKMGIPIFRAAHICAIHNHHLKLDWLVQQQYKYGMGTAEAFVKYPEITALKSFAELKTKLDALGKSGVKNLSKVALASAFGRKLLLFYAQKTEKLFQNSDRNFIFGMLASAYYWAGYRDGLKRFS